MSNVEKIEQYLEFKREEKIALSRMDEEDNNLIVSLAHAGNLDRSPKANWIERQNGLPRKIEDLAQELVKKGHTVQDAIRIAVGRAKVFAVTVKDPAKKAEWVAAVSQWEKMRAKSKAETAAKKASGKSSKGGFPFNKK